MGKSGGIKNANISTDCGLDNLKMALFRNGEYNGFFWKDDFCYANASVAWYGAGTPWTIAGTGGTAAGLAGHGGIVRLATNSNNVNMTGLQLVDFDKRPKFIYFFRTAATLADSVQQIGIYKDGNEFAVLQADADTNAAFRFLHAAGDHDRDFERSDCGVHLVRPRARGRRAHGHRRRQAIPGVVQALQPDQPDPGGGRWRVNHGR